MFREDFNRDNRILDEAFANAGLYQRLLSVTTQEAAAQIDLDLSSYDLSQFSRLQLHMELRRTSTSTSSKYYGARIRINNDSTSGSYGTETESLITDLGLSSTSYLLTMEVPNNTAAGNAVYEVDLYLTPAFDESAAMVYGVLQGAFRPSGYTDDEVAKAVFRAGAYYPESLSAVESINLYYSSSGDAFQFSAGTHITVYGVRR